MLSAKLVLLNLSKTQNLFEYINCFVHIIISLPEKENTFPFAIGRSYIIRFPSMVSVVEADELTTCPTITVISSSFPPASPKRVQRKRNKSRSVMAG